MCVSSAHNAPMVGISRGLHDCIYISVDLVAPILIVNPHGVSSMLYIVQFS